MASQLDDKSGITGDQQAASKDVLDLQHTVKSLEAQLAKKAEELQQQAASLHEHHRQKVSSLKANYKSEVEALKSSHEAEIDALRTNHKTEIDSLQGQLSTLEQQLVDAHDGGSSSQHSGSGNLPESDRVGSTLREVELQGRLSQALQENQELENARSHLESVLEELRRDIEQIQRQKEGLGGNEALQKKVIELQRNLQESEERCLGHQRELEEKNQLTQSLRAVKEEQESLLARTETAIEKIGDRQQQEITAELFDTIERENLLLKEEKLKLEENASLLEKMASTSAAERQALLRKVSELKSQLLEYIGDDYDDTDDNTWDLDLSSQNSSAPDSANAALHVSQEKVEKELQLLRSQLESHTASMLAGEMERADWMLEREALEDVITDLRKQTQDQKLEIKSLKSEKASVASQDIEDPPDGDSSEKLHSLEAEISSLREEKNELENSLEELDTQHCQAQEQLIKQRDQLMSQLAERSAQIQQQQEEIEHLNNLITELRKSGDDQRPDEIDNGQIDLEERCRQLEMELSEMKTKESSAGIEREVAELREKLHKGGLVINDLHMDKQELQDELKLSKEETAAKVAKLKEMREENALLLRDKKTLEERISEMEERLSEMEEEVERWQQVNEDKQVHLMNSGKVQEECDMLKSKVATMEKEKSLFRANFESLSAEKKPETQFSFEDATFMQILNEEAKVRNKIEEDSHVIQELRGEVQKQYESKQQLKREFHELRRSHEVCTPKITELENALMESKALLESTVQAKSEVEMKLGKERENNQSYRMQLTELHVNLEAARKEKDELSGKVSDLEQKNLSLMGQLESWQEHKNQELQPDVLSRSRLNTDLVEVRESLTAVEQELDQKLTGRDEELSILKDRNSFLERSLIQLRNDLKSVSVQQQAEMSNVNYTATDDYGDLKHEVERLKSELSVHHHLLETISQLEAGLTSSNETISQLEADLSASNETIYQLESDLSASNEMIAKLHGDLAQAQETIRSQEAGIADLNEKAGILRRKLEQAETIASRQETTCAVLRQNSSDKEAIISDLEGKMNVLVSLLSPQQLEQFTKLSSSLSIPAIEFKQAKAIEFKDPNRDHHSHEDHQVNDAKLENQTLGNKSASLGVNGSVIEDDFDSGTSDQDRFASLEKELDDLQDRLKEKDGIVSDLQRSNSSLLALLEKGGGSFDKSLSSHVSVHKLEAELRSLRGEKEQMVAVVTEKSRENSSLKSEVHRLMDVVSAGQAAIDKLQQDNRSLEQRRHSPPRDDGADDMRREALSNMARLVRDRETEIEALKQKNETLLAVLQESGESQAAAHLAPLLRDKETLMQQISSLTSEREQLIACVTQKHSESLAYHTEIQRLRAILQDSQTSSEKMKKDYETLIPAFDDKSQALLSAQNELIKCKQKLTELEIRHGELIQRSSSQDSSISPELSSLQSEIERLRSTEADLRTILLQQEEKIHVLNYRVATLEESITAKETECALLRKQVESSKFQLSGLMAEVSDMKAEREHIHQRSTAQDTESASLKENYSKIFQEARDKEIELSSLKEQILTLTSLVNEQQGEHGQVSQLMREHEAAMASTLQLQQERDQQAMMLEQKVKECAALRIELSQMKEKEFRMTKELERLRGHLMEIEDGFTKDALESEEREKDLRNRLAIAEEQLMSSSLQVDMASKESWRQIESMQHQLQQVASQRDSAYMQVASSQEQCQQYASSLSNLQLVLEHFQKEKDVAIASETERMQKECKVLRIEVKELQEELQATRGDLAEALDGLEAASRLSEQLDRKEEALDALREEVQMREHALSEAEEQIRKLNSSTEAKVDKTLMHNMVMTWLLSPENKRAEIVHLIGHVLSFSPEDFQKIEAVEGKSGILSGLFRRPSTSVSSSPAKQAQAANQSFSQLFVTFLERESSPPPSPMRLPAEAMAAETQQRHKPSFNPFMAPRHVTQDRQRSSTPSSSSHLLMPPDSPTSSPLFTPLTNISSSTESAILKDVLGKR